jgi:hypothetical protein
MHAQQTKKEERTPKKVHEKQEVTQRTQTESSKDYALVSN